MIEILSKKLKSALRSRSKSVSFTTEEVSELLIDINSLNSRIAILSKKVIDLQDELMHQEVEVTPSSF